MCFKYKYVFALSEFEAIEARHRGNEWQVHDKVFDNRQGISL